VLLWLLFVNSALGDAEIWATATNVTNVTNRNDRNDHNQATNTSDPPYTLSSLDSDAPVGVAPPVIFWKLKKVGGSTMCMLLEEYARTNDLTIATPPEWKLLGSGKTSGDSMADSPSHKHDNEGQIDKTR
jgi:hypothetical protein